MTGGPDRLCEELGELLAGPTQCPPEVLRTARTLFA
jgi:hypothetical protein